MDPLNVSAAKSRMILHIILYCTPCMLSIRWSFKAFHISGVNTSSSSLTLLRTVTKEYVFGIENLEFDWFLKTKKRNRFILLKTSRLNTFDKRFNAWNRLTYKELRYKTCTKRIKMKDSWKNIWYKERNSYNEWFKSPKNALFPDLNDFCEKLHSKRSFYLTHSSNSSI